MVLYIEKEDATFFRAFPYPSKSSWNLAPYVVFVGIPAERGQPPML